MSHDPTHPDAAPFGPLPGGLNESELLDWVEQRPSAGRAGGVEAAIRAHPALAARLEEMRVDRAAMATLGDEPAPAGLLDSVERALERRMLVGLAAGQPLSDDPPVSIFRPARRDPFLIGPVRGDAVGRRLALAAAVLLVLGGAGVLGVLAMRLAPTATPPIEIADNSTPPQPAGEGPAAPMTGADQATRLATTAGSEPSTELVPNEVPTVEAPASPGMTLARAADLARQGRLIIRVRSVDMDRTLLRLGRIADRPRFAWRLGEDAPSAVIASLQTDAPRMVDPALEPAVASWAGIEDMSSPLFPIAPIVIPRIEVQRVIPTVFLAEVRADEDALRGLLAALDATTMHTATFEEAPKPVVASGPALEPEAVLWWTLEPSAWRPWVGVPVVVAKKN